MKWSLLILLFSCFAANGQVADSICVPVKINAIDYQTRKKAKDYKVVITSNLGTLEEKRLTDTNPYTFCLKPASYEIHVFKDRFRAIEKKAFVITSGTKAMKFTFELDSTIRRRGFFPVVYFEKNKCEINDSARTELDLLPKTLKDNPNIVLELMAFSKGNSKGHKESSTYQAEAVKKYLVSKGVEAERIQIAFYKDKTQKVMFKVIRTDWPYDSIKD